MTALATIYAAGMIAAAIVLTPHIQTRHDSAITMLGTVLWPWYLYEAFKAHPDMELSQ